MRLNVPLPGRISEEAGEQTTYGDTIYTGRGCNDAELHRTIYYGGRAVLYLRVHHQLEHGAGTASAEHLHAAVCVGHACGVGLLSGVLCVLVANIKAD